MRQAPVQQTLIQQAPVRQRPGSGATVRVAAVDCGTNSLRLLIADVDAGRGELADVIRRVEIVRLGQGVDATGRLAPEALDRTLRVLADYAAAIRSAGAGPMRMVATSATRDAANAAEFVRGVRQILGIEPEVISGAEEAGLSFAGATAELARPRPGEPGPDRAPNPDGAASDSAVLDGAASDGAVPDSAASDSAASDSAALDGLRPPFLVVDIGGGSTELVLGREAGSVPRAAVSVNIGCVRLTERHLRSDPPSVTEIAAATADIDAALAEAAATVPAASARTLVGLAGSVTTVTAIALGLPAYDPARIHYARTPASVVHEVTLSLLGESREQRATRPVLHPGRVDVIGAGALILDRTMARFGFAELVTSEHDILDGIAWSLARAQAPAGRA